MSQDLFTLPRPSVDPTVGNLAEYNQDPLGFLTRCAIEYGEIVPLRFGSYLACLLSNPNDIEEVLKNSLLFVKAKDLRIIHGLIGNGLLSSEGDFWQRQRRLVQPVFHQQRINSYGEIMVDYTERMLSTWHDGEIRDIHEQMMRLTLNIVMKTIFNQDVTEGEASSIAHALEVGLNWFDSQNKSGFEEDRNPTPEDIRYGKAIDLLDQTIYAIINQRRSNGGNGGDLLSMLMQVKDEDDGSQMTDQQLRDEVATMILAGHETTANTLSWTWMLLAQHPEVQAKLVEELQAVLGGRSPTIADLPRLRYTSMIIKESMRLYPPITDVTREAIRDCEIGGYFVPAGCTIIMSQWVMHRNSRYFPNPEVFNPERWANDLEKQLPRGVYFPFGDGLRICIGKSFALMEATLLLATIAQKFQLHLVPEHLIVLQPSLTLRPKYGIQVVLKKF
ncbi:cytochrome P450 [Iningainema tapete]|uniref:Cytochrome P450 n=1 Tax=Iningainema tapete BLCC-T55 TaxID=2748662 RepID=A0A8J6XRR5_9CYAN|nr:cytochrome P450 [Iningainema tapete]MBD2778392.1 cytochrome P450 [Iningainema tapete BLCC-T55]